MPRMTARQTPEGEPATLAGPITGNCLGGILGATWMETAVVPQKRADHQLVAPKQRQQECSHVRGNCARRPRNSCANRRRATRSSRARTRTTISIAGKASRSSRKDSRTTLLMRLRAAAERTNRFATITPRRALVPDPGRYSSSRTFPRNTRRKAKTDEKSSVLRNLYALRKP